MFNLDKEIPCSSDAGVLLKLPYIYCNCTPVIGVLLLLVVLAGVLYYYRSTGTLFIL